MGGVVSPATTAATVNDTECVTSVLPASSWEYQYSVWVTRPGRGRGDTTEVPLVQEPLVESSCQDVDGHAGPVGVGRRQREGLRAGVGLPDVMMEVVTGATVSMRKESETCVDSVLLELSTE